LTPSESSATIPEHSTQKFQMQDEYLTRCVVDPTRKTVYIYSSEGTEQELVCDTTDQFMNVLKFIRSTVDEDILAYAPV